jgi:hypothetical protein
MENLLMMVRVAEALSDPVIGDKVHCIDGIAKKGL